MANSPELKLKYQTLRDQWLEKSWVLGSTKQMKDLPEFGNVIGLGTEIIPFVAEDLLTDSAFLYLLLDELAMDKPQRYKRPGKTQDIHNAWLEWCVLMGYLPNE